VKDSSAPNNAPSRNERNRPESKAPRRRRRTPVLNRVILILVLLLVLSGGAVALFTGVFGGPYIRLADISLVQRTTEAGHDAVLEQMRDISELQTVEYIYKLVFPHDFCIDGVSIPEILERSKSGGPAIEDALSPEEYRYYQAYFLARDAGLQPLSGPYDFLVITAYVELGYRLDSLDAAELVQIIPGTDGGDDRVRISLPPAEILQIRIEDPDSGNYPYPDLILDQANWGRIAAFARDHIAEIPEMDDVRGEARESLADFFATFLREGVQMTAEFARME
jgi:hypothetical protein